MEIDQKQQEKVNMIAILMDLQDQYISELVPEFKFGMKQMINRASTHTKAFIRECDKIFGEESRKDFGIDADDIRVILERELLQ